MRLREVKQLIKQTALLPALAAAFVLGACGDGTSLPTATGKANIRAINAIKTSPEVGFLIEERILGSIDFRQISSLNEYDDLDYNFNFEVFFLGDATSTRIATQYIDVVADMDYILLLSGTLSNATITVWETALTTASAMVRPVTAVAEDTRPSVTAEPSFTVAVSVTAMVIA